ncbi:MAG: hypothetical protein U0V75_17105 [Ferruginibacter sp.]
MKTFLILLTAILVISFSESCYYDKADLLYPDGKVICDTTTAAKFSTDVLPVMNTYCNSGCHNTVSASGGIILDTYNGVKTQASNGRLMGSINQTSGFSAMPKGGNKLNTCTSAKIQQWINAGMPNN